VPLLLANEFFLNESFLRLELLHILPRIALLLAKLFGQVELLALQDHAVFCVRNLPSVDSPAEGSQSYCRVPYLVVNLQGSIGCYQAPLDCLLLDAAQLPLEETLLVIVQTVSATSKSSGSLVMGYDLRRQPAHVSQQLVVREHPRPQPWVKEQLIAEPHLHVALRVRIAEVALRSVPAQVVLQT